MCVGGGGSAPAAPAKIPEAPMTPAPSARGAADTDLARRRRAAGTTGTILTGPRGIEGSGSTGAGTAKTLLGQ